MRPTKAQFDAFKSANPDTILLFRVDGWQADGWYECYGDDAKRAAEHLGYAMGYHASCVLTFRPDLGDYPEPAIGYFRVADLEPNLARLASCGCRVAVVEQAEKREAKGRAVERIVMCGRGSEPIQLTDEQINAIHVAEIALRDPDSSLDDRYDAAKILCETFDLPPTVPDESEDEWED